jgi:hypothetical protein
VASLNGEAQMANKDSEILDLAQQFGLNPRQCPDCPPNAWMARCPDTQHPLFIDLEKELYYCGWCKRGGGPSSFLDFVEEREEKARRRREEYAAEQIARSTGSLAHWGKKSIKS